MIDLNTIAMVPCHPQNRGGVRFASQIKYLVYHYTGNDGDTDQANAEYYRTTVVKASAHYFVDDDTITCSVDPLNVAWAVGGSKWSDCAKTGGGTLYGVVTNANSISIEMCDTVKDGKLMATEETLKRAAELGRALMKKYNIPIDHVVRHFDVTGKHCPAYFMDNAEWAKFKERLVKEEQDVTEDRVKEIIAEEFGKVPQEQVFGVLKDVPEWYRPTIRKLLESGALQGSDIGDPDDIEDNVLNVTETMCRVFTVLDSAGFFD